MSLAVKIFRKAEKKGVRSPKIRGAKGGAFERNSLRGGGGEKRETNRWVDGSS